MNPHKRSLFQVLFWFGVWGMVWIFNGMSVPLVRDFGLSLIIQVLLILGLVYYAVPRFLFKKKYAAFLVAVFVLVFVSVFIGMELGPEPIPRGPARPRGKGPPFLASRVFQQLVIMAITALSTILVETFSFAQQKEKSEILSKVELMQSELKFLKMQINPHFLFNALNNIYALSVTNSEKTQEGISTLSLMLRYVLYDCERPEVPLRKELEYISYFIELFKLKSSKGYNIRFIEEVEDYGLMVPPMLFIPFIENAFKHSGIEKRGKSFVNILLISKENRIEFSVENSLPAEPIFRDAHSGIGLQNVKKRLDILYPQIYQLDIKKGETFSIYLKMDLR